MNSESKNSLDLKEVVSEFHNIDIRYIWFDFFVNVLLSWPLFIYTCFKPNLIIFCISIFFLYRGTMLIHEVSHLSKKIKGYKLAYNLFFGWFSSYPAYIFDKHLYHHGKATYATKKDPEYKFIEEYNLITFVRPILASLLLPVFQVIRFGIMPFIIPFLSIEKQSFIFEKMSTLVFDTSYKRKFKNQSKELSEMKFNDLMSALYKVIVLILVINEILPWEFIYYYYFGFVIGSILNMYRAIFNHLYSNYTLRPMDTDSHILDTTTIESSILTNIIFVNGLNYHALHHLFPEIPYYNLKAAHNKAMKCLNTDHVYRKTVFKNVFDLLSHCISIRNSKVRLAIHRTI